MMQVEKGRKMTTEQINKLKGKLAEKRKTYNDCAKALGITTASFCHKVNCKTFFTIVEAKKLADYLEMSDEEIVSIFLS